MQQAQDFDDIIAPRRERMEQLRQQRAAENASPTRTRLRLGAVVVILAALLSWLAVSWMAGSSSSSEKIPHPAGTGGADSQDSGTRESRARELPPEHHEDAGADTKPASEIMVHVAGAVEAPGVVELAAGARVLEAIEQAGGASEDAALEGLNLAAEAVDGSMVFVPTREELEAGTAPMGEETVNGGRGDHQAGSLININTADTAALEQLPGIGPALAERIISHREANGPFAAVEELAAVSGIGPAVLSDIEDQVTF